jgi:hypothetical protein
MALLAVLTQALWVPVVGHALECQASVNTADAILVDNFEMNYLVFERAAEFRTRGIASRVLVPTQAATDPAQPNIIFAGIAHVMSRVARLESPELIPIREIEPISLNAAYQIRDFLLMNRLRSVIVVTPGFRSRRSALVYSHVLGNAGILTYCAPVFGEMTADTWNRSWHGVQQVAEQFLKLQYYRFYVLPLEALRGRTASSASKQHPG